MKGICMDNSHTWRDVLTVGKTYDVLRKYTDSYETEIVEIKCDDGKVRPYRTDRFQFPNGVNE